MQETPHGLAFSATDISDFLECEHLVRLERARVRHEIVDERSGDEQTDVIARRGEEHERRWLERFESGGGTVVRIENPIRWQERLDAAAQTVEAMRGGADVIHGGVFVPGQGRWSGVADFLIRVDASSDLGDWSYEAHDTKLARHARARHLLQLAIYSLGIASVQGTMPRRAHVILGTDEVETIATEDFMAYFRRLRERFREVAAAERYETYPHRVPHCDICDWKARCEAQRERDDYVGLVAGVRRDQIARLEAAGAGTLTALGRAGDALAPARMQPATVGRLRHQARLQLQQREDGVPVLDVLVPVAGAGLNRLPRPSEGDVFFDLEGDPLVGDGLEYLFGFVFQERGAWRYRAIWGHDSTAERRAFEETVDFLTARLARFPDAHVYHYAPYEVTALKRLMGRYGVREDAVDDLLRRDAFVDLYRVVRESLRHSYPGYGLKVVEQWFDEHRSAAVTEGGGSIVAYEHWLRTRDDAELEAIERYNEEDCRSTRSLRDWLIDLGPRIQAEHGVRLAWRPTTEAVASPERAEADAALASLAERLRDERGRAGALLAELLHYHRREAKPSWWAYFDRQQKTVEALVDDREALAGLAPGGEAPELVEQSLVHTLHYPPQDHHLSPGDAVDPLADRAEVIVSIDEAGDERWGAVRIRRGPSRADEPLPRALAPGQPYGTRDQQAALRRLGAAVLDGDGRFHACQDILGCTPPRIVGLRPGAALQHGHVEVAELAELVARLDRSALFVQGPPGSGKTWAGARVALQLLRQGRRVGVTAPGHKAIHNLLDEIERCAASEGFAFSGLKKASAGNDESRYDGHRITSSPTPGAFPPAADVLLVAGTAWLFSREDMEGAIDVLIVDEAGQLSLADALAVGTSAHNVVLLGDPQQLAHVSQGTHPLGSGCSVLRHVLGNDETVPPERGIFLDQSFRMHPDVCRFVSEIAYDGRLRPAPGCERQRVTADDVGSGAGLRFLQVEHHGNSRSSREEADVITGVVARLLADGSVTDVDGVERPLRPEHILVVTPYNAQVQCLRACLPDGVEAGTVDKFQGREAPVVFFSMATSSGDLVPRNIDFLFSRNRLNVAVSRARCLAVLVASPRLLDVRCRSVGQVQLVNALCRFVELASS